jgi:hypothetical protein
MLRFDHSSAGEPSSAVLALALLLALGGCSSSGNLSLGLGSIWSPPAKSQPCADDSSACIAERGALLKTMLSDKSRNWVREPAKPETYASGVRMFAYKGRKRELTCEELAIGRKEADAAPAILRGDAGKGLSAAQVSRSMILAAEVSRELQSEIKRRCNA